MNLTPPSPLVTNSNEAFTSLLTLNQERYPDLEDNVKPVNFQPSGYNNSGFLTIVANKNSGKYTGSVNITIPAQQTVALSTLNQTALTGIENMSQATAWQAFLNNNPNVNDLEQYTTIVFNAPNYNSPGSLVISANPNGKYTGEITITINAIAKKNLKNLGLKTTLTTSFPDSTQAFNAFLTLNSQVSDLKDNVTVSGFASPKWNESGTLSMMATADGKYSGDLTITIPKSGPINIENQNDLVLNIKGTQTMIQTGQTTDQGEYESLLLGGFFAANQRKYPDLSSYITMVEVVKKVDYTSDGKTGDGLFMVMGSGKYTGTTKVSVSAVWATDELIVDVLGKDTSFMLSEKKSMDQSLNDFIDKVLLSGGGADKDKWLKDQLAKGTYSEQYPVIKFIDYTKFNFLGLYEPDKATVLSDEWLNANARDGVSLTVQAKMTYGAYTFFRSFYIVSYLPKTD